MLNDQRGQPMQDVIRSQPPFDIDGQTFPSVLIHNGQELESPTIRRPPRQEVGRPDRIPMHRSAANTGPIRQPKPTPWALCRWHRQSFLPPHPLDPFVVHTPPLSMEQGGDPPIPIASILRRLSDDGGCERLFIVERLPVMPLG